MLAPLAVGAAMSATDAAIQKKVGGALNVTTNTDNNTSKVKDKFELCISSSELNEIMQIFKALEESGILTEGTGEMFLTDHVDKQKGGFLGALLGTLGASLLGNLLSGKGVIRAGEGVVSWEGVVRARSGNK